jgi:hypothetical protein
MIQFAPDAGEKIYLFAEDLRGFMRVAIMERSRSVTRPRGGLQRCGAGIVLPTVVDLPGADSEHDRDCEVVVDGAVFCSLSGDVVPESLSESARASAT